MKSFIILCIIIIASLELKATQLGNVKGKKQITLNKAVGTSIVKFYSNSPLEKFEGNSQSLQGSFTLVAEQLEQSIGQISFPVNSMKTGLSKRDDHMYGKDWLDAKSYPIVTFDVKKFTGIAIKKSDNTGIEFSAIAEGQCTLKGVSKYAKAKVYVKYVFESDATKKRAEGDLVMVDADFSVSLKDFNILGKGDIIGSKVGENIDLDIKLFGNESN
ncbi:MAG: YceI family protein [Ignavibacteria bacterium]|jgi:polyisoprenoid-binding protein YceI